MRAVTKRAWAISRLVRPSAGELGDPALAGRQRVEPRENDAARARAGGAELGLGLFGEPFGARAVGGVERLAEELSRFGAPVAPPKHGAEVGESSRSFQPRRRHARTRRRPRGAGALHARRRPRCRRHASPRRARAERRMRGRARAPLLRGVRADSRSPSARWASAASDRQGRKLGQVTSASRQDCADRQEVLEPFGDSSLFDSAAGRGRGEGLRRSSDPLSASESSGASACSAASSSP